MFKQAPSVHGFLKKFSPSSFNLSMRTRSISPFFNTCNLPSNQSFQFSTCFFINNSSSPSSNINSNNSSSTTPSTLNQQQQQQKSEEELRQEIQEEERKIKELEKQLYSEKQAMSLIFKASGSSFGFKRRSDDEQDPNPHVPQLSPEESLKARVLGYKLASLALVYGTLLNVAAAVIFIVVCYFVFDIKTVLDLKNVIRKFIRGSDYNNTNPMENLTPEERVERMTQLFKTTLLKQEGEKKEEEERVTKNQ